MSKVLVVVEGSKTERELFEKLYELYGEANVDIVSFNTHVFTLYKFLKEYYSDENGVIDYRTIRIPLFLKDYKPLLPQDRKKLLDSKFTDVILIFDFEPHAPEFKNETIQELLFHFSESNRQGKLYLNYPMVESFKDLTSLPDPNFVNTKAQKNDINYDYKKIVNNRTVLKAHGIKDIDHKVGKILIKAHDDKLRAIIQNINDESECMHQKYIDLCYLQCDMIEKERKVWILNTSILYFLEEYGSLE